jgi:hypothetical protein
VMPKASAVESRLGGPGNPPENATRTANGHNLAPARSNAFFEAGPRHDATAALDACLARGISKAPRFPTAQL